MRSHMVNLVIIHGGRTEEGVPRCSRESRRLPQELWARAGAAGGNSATGGLSKGEPGKMLSSPECEEGEGLGGGPVEKSNKRARGSRDHSATPARGARAWS